jgi:MoxR-like ATPase
VTEGSNRSLYRLATGEKQVGAEDGLWALEILVPVASIDIAWKAAIAAVEDVVGRIADKPLQAVADWWLVAGAGQASKTGAAYSLSEAVLGRDLIGWMAEVRDLQTPIPPLQWVRERTRLDDLITSARAALDVESHGSVKLPGEREAWRESFVAAAEPVVASLERGEQAQDLRLEQDDVKRALHRAEIIENSDRWSRFRRRIDQARIPVDQAVRCQAELQAWRFHATPGPWRGKVPPGDYPVVRFLRLVLDDGSVGQADVQAAIAQQVTVEDDERALAWLERVTLRWRQANGPEPMALADVRQRREAIASEAEQLREQGIDVEMVLLALEDPDLGLAQREVEQCRNRRMQQRRDELQDDLGRVVGDAGTVEGADTWARSVQELIDHDDFDAAAEKLKDFRREQRGASRRQALAEFARLVGELKTLGAAQQLIREAQQRLDDLNAGAEIPVGAIAELRNRVEQAHVEAQRRTAAAVSGATALLAERRDQLPPDAIRDAERTIEQARAEVDAGALGDAERLAASARLLVERRQQPRWSGDQGDEGLVRHVVAYVTQTASFADHDIRRLHVALKTKRFVILAGLTGSGKSTMARLYAEALGARVDNGRLLRVAVRPSWVDETEVVGYLNPLSGVFQPGWLSTLIRSCQRDPDLPFFCILDEMNLAPVEQYLADALSAMEEARSGALDTRIQLYAPGSRVDNADEWDCSIPWPENLFLLGTANVDETARGLSERVLDRANVLQLSLAVGEAHHTIHSLDPPEPPWLVRFSEWMKICSEQLSGAYHEFLTAVAHEFIGMRLGLGMRTHIELERFLANAEGVLDSVNALDLAVLQRIIPKVRGFKRDLEDGLRRVRRLLVEADCRTCVSVIDEWLRDEVPDETFLDGTDARVGLVSRWAPRS